MPSDSLKDHPVICPVCLDPILEASDTREGQQAIFCESICNSWLHRQCAGLSEALFNKYATIEDPFYCPHCRLISQDSQLQELKATVESLAKEVMALKCTEAVVGQPNPELPPPTYQLKQQDSQQQLQQVTRQILKQDNLASATVSAGTQESIATEKTSR